MGCKAAVLIFPGINRQQDMVDALRLVTGQEPILIWHDETRIPDVDVIVLPGGFSYGDYLRPGAIAARSNIMSDLVKKAHGGVTVLGVCNGFQILTEAGLLPGSLICNATLKFVCRDVAVQVEHNNSIFTSRYRSGQCISLPVANASGHYVADTRTLASMEDNRQVVFRYCYQDGQDSRHSYPKGSSGAIAGITNKAGNVLGMMPHPENAVDALTGSGTDGLPLFQSLPESVTGSATSCQDAI